MSYILDALRKAEAERQQGAVPDLHAQTVAAATLAASSPQRAALPRWLAVVALLAIVAGTAGWWARRDVPPRASMTAPAPAPTVAAAPAAVEPSAGAGAAAPPAAQAALAAATAASAPSVTPVTPVTPAAPAVAAQGAVATKPARADKEVGNQQLGNKQLSNKQLSNKEVGSKEAGSKEAGARKQLSAKAAPPRQTPPRAAAAAAPPPAARLPALAELPAALRQQVPALAIGGSVYSPQPSARLVIVNGQVLQEGASLAPRLTLEQIRAKSAVFSIDGRRFEVPM